MSRNPWVTAPADPPTPEPEAPQEVPETPTGPITPQRGVSAPARLLPISEERVEARVWVVGAHGGAGESTVASLADGWRAAEHTWPAMPGSNVVLTARTNSYGLMCARDALTQWASGSTPDVNLLGLVLIEDAPGRSLPRTLRDLEKLVVGGAPRHWRIPWCEPWRLGEDARITSPRQTRKAVSAVESLITPGANNGRRN